MALRRLLSLLAVVPGILAQSCWRDTPCSDITEAAFSGDWDKNIFAPSSRTVSPASVLDLANASVISSYPGVNTLTGNGSALVFDFGIEVGGIATIKYTTTGGGSGSLGLAFTEAKNWIGEFSDSSNGKFAHGIGDLACDDGAVYGDFTADGEHSYTMDDKHLRGGFRYLTLFLLTNSTTSSLCIDDISLEIGFQPTWSNLRAYQGYFHSDDDELNKIWYSGAYTLQTNAVPTNTGRQVPTLSSGWANNGTLANGTVTIVDGAKRDRAVWPGDMGIAVPSTFYSVGDLELVQTALQTMYDHQNADGSFPEAGPPLLQQGSDTYHMWTMIGTYNYILYTNHTEFLDLNWDRYEQAMEYIYAKVHQPSGLLNVTGTRDWARAVQGGENTEANVILYRTLLTGAELANWQGNTTLASTYTLRATALAKAIIAHTWDESYGAFRDNATNTTLHPQDANSMAILFGVVGNMSAEAQSVSERLTKNWTPIGAETPELPYNISPFISSFEIQGHFVVGQADRALDLIRRSWGWYLNNANGTGSTVIEGYLTNGSFAYRNYRGYDYDASYVSHAHGWSSGPTSALTNYVLGLEVTGRVGSEWRLAPQFGGLTSVEGGFTTGLGKFQASWKVVHGGDEYTLRWSVPEGTQGSVVLPALPTGNEATVEVSGKKASSMAKGQGGYMLSVGGGSGKIVVKRKRS